MKKLSTVVLLSMLECSAMASSVAPDRLPIINDDYSRARAEATNRHIPLFIEVWAPW